MQTERSEAIAESVAQFAVEWEMQQTCPDPDADARAAALEVMFNTPQFLRALVDAAVMGA